VVFGGRAVQYSEKELCAVDERSVVSSKQKLCSVRRKRCVVSNKRAVWCSTKDQDDHFNVMRLQSSDRGKARNDVKRQVIERCDILILKGVGGDLRAGNDRGVMSGRRCCCCWYTMFEQWHTYQGVMRRKVSWKNWLKSY
jgi:hypothetical protein